MSYIRWALTVFAFPLAGWVAVLVAGRSMDPVSAALTGSLAGALIGAAQWAALGRAASWRWVPATAAGLGVGAALASPITANGIDVGSLALTGLVTGALVGAGQGMALRRGWMTTLIWTTTLAVTWTIGWIVSAFVLTTDAAGWVVFGLSGSILVTVVTGLVLQRILGVRPRATAIPKPSSNAPASAAVAR